MRLGRIIPHFSHFGNSFLAICPKIAPNHSFYTQLPLLCNNPRALLSNLPNMRLRIFIFSIYQLFGKPLEASREDFEHAQQTANEA
jgi:hypothetical protein